MVIINLSLLLQSFTAETERFEGMDLWSMWAEKPSKRVFLVQRGARSVSCTNKAVHDCMVCTGLLMLT